MFKKFAYVSVTKTEIDGWKKVYISNRNAPLSVILHSAREGSNQIESSRVEFVDYISMDNVFPKLRCVNVCCFGKEVSMK